MIQPLSYDRFMLEAARDGSLVAQLRDGNFKHGKLDLGPERKMLIDEDIEKLVEGELDDRKKTRLGELMYKSLFPDEIGKLLASARDEITRKREKGLRVIIRFPADSIIGGWPLEFLRDPGVGTWLATEKQLTLSRQVIFEDLPFYTTEENPERMRILVIVSKPEGTEGVMAARILEEIKKMETAQPEEEITGIKIRLLGKVEPFERPEGLEYLDEPATFKNLGDNIDWQPHIVHFIGHGDVDDEQSFLLFVRPDGQEERISADDLAQSLWEMHPSLVILQACKSAHPSTRSAFLNLASSLAGRGIPAVVAMQFAIRSDCATHFSVGLYHALKHGLDIDAAVQVGRWRIAFIEDPWNKQSFRWSDRFFGTPVLYMLKPIGIVQPGRVEKKKVPQLPVGSDALRPAPAPQFEEPLNAKLTRLIQEAIAKGDVAMAQDLTQVLLKSLSDQRARPAATPD